MAAGNRGMLTAILCIMAAWSSAAHADWAACQRKPTRACVLERLIEYAVPDATDGVLPI